MPTIFLLYSGSVIPWPGLSFFGDFCYPVSQGLCDTGWAMPIEDLQQAAQKIAGLLNSLNKQGGMRLKFRITAGEGENQSPLNVELAGTDVPLLTQHNGELLRALETVANQILRLDLREGDAVSFDAGNFKALHEQELRMTAETAAEKVRRTGVPFTFPPTNSRERRMMHMISRNWKAWSRPAWVRAATGFSSSIPRARPTFLWRRLCSRADHRAIPHADR